MLLLEVQLPEPFELGVEGVEIRLEGLDEHGALDPGERVLVVGRELRELVVRVAAPIDLIVAALRLHLQALDHVRPVHRRQVGPDALLAMVYRPYNLEDVVLAEEALAAAVEQLVEQLVHVGNQVHLPVDSHALKAEEAVMDEVEVPIVLDVVHGLVARLECLHQPVGDNLAVSFREVCLNVLF